MLRDERTPPALLPQEAEAPTGVLADALARPLHDLRISVTDRCNFRCVYCMPKEVFDKDYQYLPHDSLLTFEEIARIAGIFVAHGVEKIRLTGGEPLLRKDVERLVAMLRKIDTPGGRPLDLTLTTNGALRARVSDLCQPPHRRRAERAGLQPLYRYSILRQRVPVQRSVLRLLQSVLGQAAPASAQS